MDDSDSSSLSEHSDKEISKLAPIFLKAKLATKKKFPPPQSSPPKPQREKTPDPEPVLADNPDIAFIVMFRSRFNDAMAPKLPNFGPQDIERGVVDSSPTPEVSSLLCALLGLVLNRKKPPERGHHGRALEEAIALHKNKKEWPLSWGEINPLHGGKSFENMTPVERLQLLRTLTMWCLSNSEAIQAIVRDKYKQSRHNDDENQPLSVQPWGADQHKRRYFLIQGLDDTSFRIYREDNRYSVKNAKWRTMAGTIEEAKELSKKLEEVDKSQAARRLASKITNAIPTFEATEEKRRRREYRQMQRARFSRPEPGFSLYEGRTRGKRMRYTYEEDDDMFLSDATSTRRSTRVSSRATPVDSGPVVTSSGRHVRQPRTGDYGESLLSAGPINSDELGPDYSDNERHPRRHSATDDSDEPVRGGGRPTRAAAKPIRNGMERKRTHIDTYNSIDEMSDEDEAGASGDEWDSDQNDREDEDMPDADDEADNSDAASESDDEFGEPQSLILKLKVPSQSLAAFDSGKLSPHSVKSDDHPPQPGAVKMEIDANPVLNDTPMPIVEAQIRHVAPQPQQYDLQRQHDSSPLGSSAYPTPTSSSFVPPEQKLSTIPTAPSMAVPSQQFFVGTGQPFQLPQ